MHWITIIDEDGYPQLIDVSQYPHIFINKAEDQSESDKSRIVWCRYDGGKDAIRLYTGTEVECIRIIEQLHEKLNAIEIDPWSEQK